MAPQDFESEALFSLAYPPNIGGGHYPNESRGYNSAEAVGCDDIDFVPPIVGIKLKVNLLKLQCLAKQTDFVGFH